MLWWYSGLGGRSETIGHGRHGFDPHLPNFWLTRPPKMERWIDEAGGVVTARSAAGALRCRRKTATEIR